jgi:ATP-binding cassette, subfamily B, bacterial
MPTDAVRPSLAAGRRLILRLLARHWRLGLFGVGTGVLWAAGKIAAPLIVSWTIGHGIRAGHLPAVFGGAGALLAVAALTAVAAGGRRYAGEGLGAHVDADLRAELFDKMQRLHLGVYERIPVGEMLNRTSTDTQQIRHPIVNGPLTVANVVLVIGSVSVLLVLDPLLALLTVLPSLLVLPITVRMVHRLETTAGGLHAALAAASVAVQEGLAGLRTIKGLGTEQREIERVEARSREVHGAATDLVRVRATYLPLTDVLPTFGMVAVVWLGGRAVSHGDMALSTLVTFSYFVTMLVGPLRTIGMTAAQFQRASLSGALVASILSLPTDAEDDHVAGDRPARRSLLEPGFAPPRLAFEDVWFGYTPDDQVVRGLDLVVEPGETVAVVGGTGSGKSTLLWLASRLYDPGKGRITLDGTDLRDVPGPDLRGRVTIQSGEAFLFEGTIAENIGFGRPDATTSDIVAAARIAGVDAFVSRLPAGYETVVSARGRSLSGGQRQRIALARAVLMDAELLLLDEPLSAVDAEMEAEVRGALASVIAARTCLLVAHRPSTLALADRAVLLVDGAIVDSGSHGELVARSAAYRAALALDDAEPLAHGSGVEGPAPA